jgi:CubicO group peptidase (beta-lactamase class C family)
MTTFPDLRTIPERALVDLREIGDRLKDGSSADTVACAFGIGPEVVMWYDDSDGRYFDLASLTKPLFTAPTVLRILSDVDAVDRSVASYLPWIPVLAETPTVRQLLTHSGGLPAELPSSGDSVAVSAWVVDQVREVRPPVRVTYSDPSYWLLGEIAVALAGQPLETLFAAGPAGAADFLFGVAPANSSVPAGPVSENEQQVHDPAARRLGTSGHAGAFGTLAGVVAAVVCWLDLTWLSAPVSADAISCQTHATPGGHRSLAWTLAGDPFHAVAHDWPASTLCHTGFTGVSVALDPVSRWWAVYLSNAIPIDRDATPVLIARRHFHAAAAQGLRAHLTTVGPRWKRTSE